MERDMSLPSLEPMIGRVVKVYKGGPESRLGRLLAVNDDHLVLHTEKDGVLYYYLRHIKSIAEDTKEFSNAASDEEVEFLNMDSMEQVLESLIGKNVQLDRGGPESRSGRLLACSYDHITLETQQEGVLYSRLHHIKSISLVENANEQNDQNQNQNGKAQAKAQAEQVIPDFIDEEGFDELLDALKYRWVKINRGGPESIEGVLVDSSGDHLVLVVQQEVSRIPTYHIRNISVAAKKAEEQQDENNNNQNSNNQNQNQNNKLSSDDISYIEKMLSEKYKSRSSSRSSDRSSDRRSDRRSSRRSERRAERRSDRRSDRRERRSSSSDRRSSRRSNRREKTRNENRREKNRDSKKRKAKRSANRLTFFSN